MSREWGTQRVGHAESGLSARRFGIFQSKQDEVGRSFHKTPSPSFYGIAMLPDTYAIASRTLHPKTSTQTLNPSAPLLMPRQRPLTRFFRLSSRG